MEFQINFSTENLRKTDDLIEVIQTDKERKNFYQMSLDDFIKIITSASSNSRVSSPFLPKNCIRYIKTSSGYEVIVEIPKKRWMINFNGNMFEVGFPRLLFMYECDYDDIQKIYSVKIARIFALKGSENITSDTSLFQFPFSHVDDSGNVCMGGNVFNNIRCLSELELKHNLFFHSPFSSDYGSKTTLGKPVAELFSDVFNEKDFNDEVLLPTNHTFSEFFKVE